MNAMNFQLDYDHLLKFDKEIRTIKKESTLLKFLFSARFKSFYQENEMRLKIARDTITRLIDKYVQKDQEGNALKTEDEKEFIYKDDASKIAFDTEMERFLKTSIIVKL